MAATPEMFTVPSSLSILILEADRGKITQPAMISTMIQALEQQLDGGPLADLKSVVVDGPGFVKEVQSLVSTYDHVIGKQLPRFQGVDKVLVVEGQRIVADSVSLIQQHTVGLISSSAQANEAEIAIGALSDGPIYPFKSPLKAYVITTQCFEAGLDRLEQSLSATASPSLTAAEVSTTVIVEAEAYLADIHSGLEMTRPYAYSVIHMAVTAVEGTALSIARSSNSVAETQFTSILSRVTTDPRTTSLGGELLRILGIPSSVSSPVSSPVLSSQPPEGETSTLTVSGASKTPGTESNVTNTSGTASSSASPLAAPPVVAPISPLVAPPVVVTDAASYDPSTQTVQFQLAQPSLTSAGVFDAEGRLVRVLWTMSELSAGTHVASWDGFNDEGVAAPAGAYSINIILNRETSQNVAAIGNSETNPNVSFDTPDTFAGVTVDPTGAIYTANLWDEPGADFEKWDSQGNAVYNAEFYVRNSVPGGLPYSITSDSAYFYIAVSIQNGLQQIERYNLATGAEAPFLNAGGRIDVTEPSAPAGYVYPLTSLAVAGSSLWVVDALRGLLLQYDKSSGVLLGQFAVSSPQAVAIDASGNLWIGQHDNTISIYSPGGELLGSPLTHLQSIAGIAFGPDGRLYVADSVAGQVKIYRINGTTATLSQTLGNKATPGDTNPADFSTLAGVAVDPAGDIITIENQPVVGSRLARWSPSGQLLWEQFGNESQSIGTYSQANPSLFYTTSFHAYDLTDPSTGSWSYIDNTFSGGTPYASASDGVPRILSIAGSQFYFMPNGDGVQIYQIEDGIYHLASIIGGDSPAPDGSSGTEAAGQWTWDDATGTGIPTAAEMHWFTSPGQVQYPAETMNVDDAGNIWFANRLDGSIWEIPMGPLDDLGNPTYEWSSAVKVVQPDESALGFLPRVVQRATDGSIYALGSSTEWPSGPSELWMGGTTLVKYDSSGNLLWAVKAPEMCTGFDFVPGGGVMIGGGTSAIVYQYSSDGLLIGDLSPGSGLEYTSGWMDENGSLVVDRSPVDGELDVFTEDDYGLHIGWYRVNDQLVTNLTVPISSPSIPAAVTGLSTPSVSPSGVTLSWEPTPDVSGYIVERSPNGSNDWVTISDIESSILDPSTAMLSLTDTTPQPTDTVYYQVYARNSAGLSASSTTIAVTVPTTSVGTTVSNDMSQIAYFSFDASGPLTQPWTQSGGTWTQSGGVLYQTSSVPGNKKALLTDQSYPANTQITAKVRVDDWNDTNSGDTVGGVGVLTDPSTGSGYNLVFSSADSVSFLDDQVALGNSYSFDWNPGTWYWFQLADIQGTLYGKIWQDGTTEPSDWMFEQSGWTDRTAGAPSLNGGSGNATVSISDVSIDATFTPIIAVTLPTGSASSPWGIVGGAWTQAAGVMSQTSVAPGDKKAVLTDQSYPTSSQITANVQVGTWSSTSDVARAGVGILTDPTTGHGYNLLFQGSNSVSFLDDQVAWGNTYSFDWNPGTSYWFQLADIQGTLYGKIWQDGTTEPSDWMFEQSGWTDRTAGAPSLNGGSGNTTVAFSDVSIDATFTPTIAATPPPGGVSSPWGIVGGDWVQTAGELSQASSASGDKKAVLTNQTYPADSQITAKVRVETWSSTSDVARAGVGILTDPTTGNGYNLLFRGSNSVSFLDDQVSWGNSYSFDWNPGTSYWFQLADIQGTLYGKIWQDGTTEPSAWMFEQSGWTDRTAGAPSLNGGSGNATVSFSDVSIDAPALVTSPIVGFPTPTQSPPTSTWTLTGGDWIDVGGMISQTSVAAGDKKAILTDRSYPINSSITARVEVISWSDSSDVARAGVGILTDPTSGHGYNLLFRGSNSVSFLDDQVSWGNSYSFDWNPGTWYWFKLVDIQGTLYGKIWQDGSTEPSAWMFEQSGWTDRTAGAPSLNGGAGNATVSFTDVSIGAPAPTGLPITGFSSLATPLLTPSWALNNSDRIDGSAMASQMSITGYDIKTVQINQSLTANSFHLDDQIPRGPRNNRFRSLLRGY